MKREVAVWGRPNGEFSQSMSEQKRAKQIFWQSPGRGYCTACSVNPAKRPAPEFSGFNFERVETPDCMFMKSERVLLAEARIPPTK